MKERKIINTNIRLNLLEESDRKAWEHLQHMDRKQYKSYSRAVVAALNDYFDRKEKLEDDPYLETREKEDAFLENLISEFGKRVESAVPLLIAENLFRMLQPAMPNLEGENLNRPMGYVQNGQISGMTYESEQELEEMEKAEEAALDFADSF